MKNILIATDFSKEAYCALFYATRLFQKENSKFYIANFYGEKIHPSVYSIVNEEEFSKTQQYKMESETGCNETLHNIIRDSSLESERFEVISSEQKLLKGIENQVPGLEIDMLVMGTGKHRGTLASISGTHTTNVIEKALLVPTLIIPRELEYTAPAHIAFASELLFEFNFEALQILREIALKFNSRITLIHDGMETELSKRQWKNYDDFKSFFEGVPVHIEFSYPNIEVSRTIAEFVKNKKVDLLCMEYYKHSLTGNLFREPVVEKIDRHLSFPFLILPAKS